jgi:hypothetical protein
MEMGYAYIAGGVVINAVVMWALLVRDRRAEQNDNSQADNVK